MSLSYGLSLNGVLFWAIYVSCFLENKMLSVERVKQFTNIAPEANWESKHAIPPTEWPNEGNIQLKHLQVILLTFFDYFIGSQYTRMQD